MTAAELLRRLETAGYAVDPAAGVARLVPLRPDAVIHPDLLAGLRERRAEILAYLAACAVCARDVSDPEDRARLVDPLFCDRGGSMAVTDGLGVSHPATYRCPYKE